MARKSAAPPAKTGKRDRRTEREPQRDADPREASTAMIRIGPRTLRGAAR
ncbi:MAG TPA: hypothetical protein VFM56_04135 [Solimonas sp.]|nr:hypothetical protein [Solimonas sp.]